MKNLQYLIFIFERDFVKQEDDVIEVHDIELEILEENDEIVKANVKLSVDFTEDDIGVIEISQNVYKKKYLEMIAGMEQYQKEIEDNS
jgi:hypothetical protein